VSFNGNILLGKNGSIVVGNSKLRSFQSRRITLGETINQDEAVADTKDDAVSAALKQLLTNQGNDNLSIAELKTKVATSQNFFSPYNINLLDIANIINIKSASGESYNQLLAKKQVIGQDLSPTSDYSANNVATLGHIVPIINFLDLDGGTAVTLQSDVIIDNTLDVSGKATFNSDVSFNGDVSFNQNVNISGNLIVDGSSTFQRIKIIDISNETFGNVSYSISDSSNEYNQSYNSTPPPPDGPPSSQPSAEFKSHLVFLKNATNNNKIYNISPADASGQVVEYAQWRAENNKIKDAIDSLNAKLNHVINFLK
jgi:hypothetical protein